MRQQYGVGETVKNVVAFIYTKIFFCKARLIRKPFYLRGKKYFEYGQGLTTGYGCRFEMFESDVKTGKKIIIGEQCLFGDYVHISACQQVEIGNHCLMASHVLITDNSHGDYNGTNCDMPETIPNERKLKIKPVKIDNNVWIGENVCILQGVNIGDGCVVGAGSVVNKSFPAGRIIAGAPAKIIKIYDAKSTQWKSAVQG